jgi:TolB-like protein/Tfp pilus assembly protein PilF
MFTDIVGYSLTSARNEKKALEQVAELRSLLQGVFSKFDGRVVKTMGDGFLVEFASAVKAVDCAIEAQKELARINTDRAADDKLRIRIGIHVGDVIHSEGDVLGDAVNVASRVQSLADPGGILVTRQVFDQVKGKVQSSMNTTGLHELKNIPGQVEIFRVLPRPADLEKTGRHELDPHRVAILPFANLSPDPNDGYFADGLTEELISTISRIGELSVISRASAMRYKDMRPSTDQVGQELRVGTILEGSVRKAGNKVRITAELLDVEGDRYIWSQNYDRDLTDIFGVQGDIAQKVADGLKVELLMKERQSLGKRTTISTEAYTLYLKGRYYWNERSEAGVNKAIRYFQEAARLDPRFAEAYSGLADAYMILADYRWMEPGTAGALAKENANRALSIDDTIAEAHASLGLISVNHLWDFAAGEQEFKRAIRLNANYAPAYHWYAVMLYYSRRYQDSLEMIRRAAELDPNSHVIRQGMGTALLGLGKTSEALQIFRRVAEENPDFMAVRYWMAVAYLLTGEFPKAVEEAEKEVELDAGSDDSRLDLAWVKGVAGDREGASHILDEVRSRGGGQNSPVSVAAVELAIGNADKGFDLLRAALEGHDPSLLYFRSVPAFSKYWSHPRWVEIDRGAGLPS